MEEIIKDEGLGEVIETVKNLIAQVNVRIKNHRAYPVYKNKNV